jgi:hypothetical protein
MGCWEKSLAVISLLWAKKQRTSLLFSAVVISESDRFSGRAGSAGCFFAANNSKNSGGAPGLPMGAAAALWV